jgi:hypothetical protein
LFKDIRLLLPLCRVGTLKIKKGGINMLYQNHKKNMIAGIRWSIVLTVILIICYALVRPMPTEILYLESAENESAGVIHLPRHNPWLDIPVAFLMFMTFWTFTSLAIGVALSLDKNLEKAKSGFFVCFGVFFVASFLFFRSIDGLLWLLFIHFTIMFCAFMFLFQNDPAVAMIVALGGWEGVTLTYCLKTGFAVGFAASLILILPAFILIFFLHSLFLGIRFGLIPHVKLKPFFAWLNAADFKVPEEIEAEDTDFSTPQTIEEGITESPPDITPDTPEETAIG